LGAGDPGDLDRAAVGIVGIFVLQAVAGGLRYYLFTTSGERIVTRLRAEPFRSEPELRT
jgi:ATP-binding cassette subfamily B protein